MKHNFVDSINESADSSISAVKKKTKKKTQL